MRELDKRELSRTAILGLLLIMCVLSTCYSHFILKVEVFFTHLFYLPIILASLWWSRKGIAVAVLLALLVLLSHSVSRVETPTGTNVARAAMFVVVGTMVAVLNEKKQTLEEKLRSHGKTLEEQVEQRTHELRELQEKQRAILDSISDAIVDLDGDLNITWANETALDRYGAIPGKKCYQAYKWLAAPCADCVARATYADGMTRTSEEEGVLRDGTRIDYVASCSPIRDCQGEVVSVVEVLHDITKQKRAEEALQRAHDELEERVEQRTAELVQANEELNREIEERTRAERAARQSEERFFKAFHASPIGIAITTVEEGRLVDVNDSLLRTIGYTRDEVIGRTKAELGMWSAPEDPVQVAQKLKAGEGSVRRHETLLRTKSGEVRRGVLSVEVIDIEGGQCLLTMIDDVTERRQALKALKQSEERLAGIVDAVTDCMVMLDEEYKIVWANRFARETFGRDPIGRTCYQEFCSREEPCERCPVKRSFADSEVHDNEIEVIGPNEKPLVFWCTASVVARHDDGQPETVVEVCRDVTERKQAQETLRRAERLSSLGTLAAGIAHEINNPVGAAMLAAETALAIKDDPDNAKRSEKCLNNMVASLDRCGRIVRNMLTFSRDEPPETRDGVKQPCQISEVIRQSRDLARSCAQRHRTTIRLALDRDLPEVVIGRLDVELALINLLRNAIEAGGEDGQVVIRAESADAGVRISVEDNGCGMTDEQKKHVFDPFYTTWQVQGGTGLGLSITYGIVQDHGGTIEVESTPGEGTTVSVTLPAHENLAGTDNGLKQHHGKDSSH